MRKSTRRSFLKSTLAASAVMGAPSIVPSSVFGANAPSNRITLGCIGTGNQGFNDMRGFLRNKDARVVAVCDVNTASYGYKTEEQYYGREPARKEVDAYYAENERSGRYKGCDAYKDFREVLARDDIDAVIIVVPDHWHAIMTIAAARVGKDVYCEKPLSLTVAEGRKMIEAVRRNAIILQTGSHERSRAQSRFACELVRSGRIGEVKKIITKVGFNNKFAPEGGWEPTPVPKGFDYDMWLGPAPWVPHHKDRCFYSFRFGADYSGGQTTNYGAHSNDLAQWGNNTDLTGPVEFWDMGSVWPRDGLFTVHTRVHFGARYANGVELECVSGPENVQARFEGTEGWVQTGYRGFTTWPENLKRSVIGPGDVHLYESPNHYRNFLDCVKSRLEPASPVEIGHSSCSLCLIGNIAMTLKRRLQWDPDKERFVNDAEANSLLSKPFRAPWSL